MFGFQPLKDLLAALLKRAKALVVTSRERHHRG
jgi:hypothetical protein